MAGYRATALSLTMVAAAGLISAQNQQLSVRGRVVDPAKAALPGASVSVIATPGENPRSTVTTQQGEFSLALDPGTYTLTIATESFVESVQRIEIANQPLELNEIVLQLAPVLARVIVVDRAGYLTAATSTATRTLTLLRDVPQSITIVTQDQIKDQLMSSIGDLVSYVPGITATQGENNRDQLTIRGNSTSADFFVNGVRDDVQYYRDLYNLDRVEALKGPNAMIFGRGGAGGVVNRVTKEAGFTPLREITLTGGSFGGKRAAFDIDQPLHAKAAFRLNAMYENSGSFRDFVSLERHGVNPTLTLLPDRNTKITLSYEDFHDDRGSDRGIPSFQNRPIETGTNTFFGNPDYNTVRALVNIGAISIERQLSRWNLKNRMSIGDYDRGYQNFVPGAVTVDGTRASLTAYNNATQRRNIFNQTDLTGAVRTGRVRHTLLVGAEAGRQLTNNFRNTGFFNNTDTSILVPLSNPVIHTPVTFRQNATDANNHLKTNVGAVYVQDQLELSRFVQVLAGVRFDHFDLRYHDNRSGNNLRRIDNLISPRAGVVFKPIAPVSIYGSYGVSYLPSSGDQFSSLTTITQQVKPEKFSNYEVGVKWDLSRNLALTTAVYRLERTNTRSTDPNDPTRIVQTGSTRSNGYELGLSGSVTGRWRVAGGYGYQDVFVTRATTAARAGAQVAQTPHHTFSLWNNFQILPRLGAGLGVLNRSDMFAAIDNTVILPSYTRADAAMYYSVTERVRFQINVENLTDRKYSVNADNNNNISPGSPRAVRVGVIARF